jgi:uncharacterized membrane protein
MKGSFRFFRTTALGGLLFLVPIVVLIVIIGKAFEIAKRFTTPVARILPFNPAADVAIAGVLAVALLFLVCFLAGLLAKNRIAKKSITYVEENILMKLPPYIFIKDMSQSMIGMEQAEGLKPVLAKLDDAWQIGLEVERIEGGYVIVFIPGAPSPWSGDVLIFEEARIKPLNTSFAETIKCMRLIGRGAGKMVKAHLS